MAAKYDLEELLSEIETMLKAKLNDKFTQINAEKNDGIVLASIPAQAYFLQQLNGGMANWPTIILYGVDEIQSSSRGPNSNSKFTLSVIVITVDSASEVNIGKRMLRYSRALEEVFRENWTGGRNGVKLEVKSLVPVPLTNLNSNKSHRAVGVQIDANLAG